jgi:hypothetical protein
MASAVGSVGHEDGDGLFMYVITAKDRAVYAAVVLGVGHRSSYVAQLLGIVDLGQILRPSPHFKNSVGYLSLFDSPTGRQWYPRHACRQVQPATVSVCAVHISVGISRRVHWPRSSPSSSWAA